MRHCPGHNPRTAEVELNFFEDSSFNLGNNATVGSNVAVEHNKVITVNFGEVNKKRAVNLCIHGKRILESKEKVYWDDLGLRNLKAEGGMDSYIEKAEKKPSIKDFCIF